MNGRSLALLLIVAALGASFPVCAQQDMSGAVSRVNDSVFTIKTDKSLGSGFVVDSQGNALTCQHVIGAATQVDITTLANGDQAQATVVAKDVAHDLALLKLNRTGLPAVVFAPAGTLQAGARVAAVGAPLGLTNSVTEGVVSALDREINGQKYMQIDAPLNSGNSGGPVVDDHGDVVGIATAVVKKANNVGFALPSDVALAFLRAQGLTGAVALSSATGPAPTAPAGPSVPPAGAPVPPQPVPPVPPPAASPGLWMLPVLSLVISLVVSLLVSLLVTRAYLQRMGPGGGALPPTPGYLPPPPTATPPPPQQQDLSDIDITLG